MLTQAGTAAASGKMASGITGGSSASLARVGNKILVKYIVPALAHSLTSSITQVKIVYRFAVKQHL